MDIGKQGNLKCKALKEGFKLCKSDKCDLPAVMCQDQGCECHVQHKTCTQSIPLYLIQQMISRKLSEPKPHVDPILSWYQKRIKMMTIQLSEFKARNANRALDRSSDEGRLYGLIKDGQSGNIKGGLVAKSVANLGKKLVFDPLMMQSKVEERLCQLSARLDSVTQDLKLLQVLQDPETLALEYPIPIGDEIAPSYRSLNFNEKLCNPYLKITGIYTVESQYELYQYAVMQPALSNHNNTARTFGFKVLSSAYGNISFGICNYKEVVEKKHFQQGGYLFGGYLCSFKRQSIMSNVNCLRGGTLSNTSDQRRKDQIFVTYDSRENKVIFRFGRKYRRNIVVDIQSTDKNELHLCVLLYHPGDKVKYLGQFK